MEEHYYKRYAFISYSHHDKKVAKWLQRKLEHYRLPTEIHNEFEDSKYLRPIFRDEDELNGGVLDDELRKHLERSKYLIVICSPNCYQSNWVSDEVKEFIKWGRLDNIIPFIVNGTPKSGGDDECWPKSLLDHVREYPKRAPLGISIKEGGREKAFIKVVSYMLGVSFDELWKRHEREKRRKILSFIITAPIILSLLYYFAVPISLEIQFIDSKHHLPMPDNAIVIVNGAEYPLQHLDTTLVINGFPGYYRGRAIPISFSANWYTDLKENVPMGWGLNSKICKVLQRDDTFSTFSGKVLDEGLLPLSNVTLYLEEEMVKTDNDGKFSFIFPVKDQSVTKKILIKKEGYHDYVREDECPGTSITYILRKK